MATPGIKVSEKAPGRVPALVVETTEVTREMDTDSCTSTSDALVDKKTLAADEAHTKGSPVKKPAKATVQVLKKTIHDQLFPSRKAVR